MDDEALLLAVLNSAPVLDGRPSDELDGASGRRLTRSWGGCGSRGEVETVRRARDALQALVRGDDPAAAVRALDQIVADVRQQPSVTRSGVAWTLLAPRDGRLAARTVLAWAAVDERLPGRLRACANTECNLFLVDHSRPGTARWCSMSTCGNRMKARAHAQRTRHTG